MSKTDRPATKRRSSTWTALTVTAMLFFPVVIIVFGYPYLGRLQYSPRAGDVIFQSLPHSPIVNSIEHATASPYSHCGIVANDHGDWVVYEAYSQVEQTPLNEFLQRGRNYAFAVYRLKPEFQSRIPAILEAAREQMGKPYDSRYRLDDDAIYCSELVYKAFRTVTDEELGQLVDLRDLRWRAHRQLIEKIEGGPVPLDREMITPKHLSQAAELRHVFSHGYSL